MNINELRKERSELEQNLASAISTLLEEFSNKTGFSPHSINVDMLEVSVWGRSENQFVVGQVKVFIDI